MRAMATHVPGIRFRGPVTTCGPVAATVGDRDGSRGSPGVAGKGSRGRVGEEDRQGDHRSG
jgi:hypothetical protein